MSSIRHPRAFPWTDEQIAMARDLRSTGLGYAEIARRLGTSVGSVAGKCMRLELPAPTTTRKVGHPPRRRLPAPDKPVAPPTTPPGPALDRVRTCQWIYDTGPWWGRTPQWCGEPAALGKSWCPYHCKKLFVPGAAA